MTSLLETGYAKINLALHVRRRRVDGYHDLETVFAFLEDGDAISVTDSDNLEISITGPFAAELADVSDNLVMQAAFALKNHANVDLGAALHLTKNLPVASGIGGGSADAAATLRLLNRFWGTNLTVEELAELARPLGADVAACVHSRICTGTGVGDDLFILPSNEMSGCPVLLINPGIGISTPQIFDAWDGVDRGALPNVIDLISLVSCRNDLQDAAVKAAPEIVEILEALSKCSGAKLVRMSGSGATSFALFNDKDELIAAQQSLEEKWPNYWYLQSILKC